MKKCELRKSMFSAALVLLTAGIALGQSQPQTAVATPDSPVARPTMKSLTVSGKVSHDGHALVTDIDTEWAITNPEALKGRETTLVTVKCFVDPERNQLRILSVKTSQPEFRYASRSGDSAFRR